MNIKIGSALTHGASGSPQTPGRRPGTVAWMKIAEAGYEWTELGPYGYLPTDLPTLRAELAKRSESLRDVCHGALEDPSAWPEIERQVLGGGALLAALDVPFLVLIDDVYSDLFTGQSDRPQPPR